MSANYAQNKTGEAIDMMSSKMSAMRNACLDNEEFECTFTSDERKILE